MLLWVILRITLGAHMQISLSYVTRHEFAGFLGVSMLNYRVQVKPLSKVQHYLFYALTSKDQSFMCFLKKKSTDLVFDKYF